jgi:hypothetical protein
MITIDKSMSLLAQLASNVTFGTVGITCLKESYTPTPKRGCNTLYTDIFLLGFVHEFAFQIANDKFHTSVSPCKLNMQIR